VDSLLGGATDEMYYAAAGGGFYGYADGDHDSDMDALMGGGWHGVGAEYENGNIMEAFGLNDGVAMDSGAGQDSADVFKHTEGGSGIYHAGNEIPRSIELPTGGGDTPGEEKTPGMGGGSDDSDTGSWKGADGQYYGSKYHADKYGGGNRGSSSHEVDNDAHMSVGDIINPRG